MLAKKKHRIQGVLFDWDGTLLNSYHADSSAYLAMFREMEIPWGLEELTRHYSPNWYDVYRAAKLPRHRWNAADRAWRAQYANHKPRLIKGARQILAKLFKQHQLGIVTSGDRDRVIGQIHEFRLRHLFKSRVCSGDTRQKKPHPAPLRLALREMGLKPDDCVYIGDAPHDVEMARRAGVLAIGVLGPFPTEERLRASKPDLLLSSLADLPAALKSLDQ